MPVTHCDSSRDEISSGSFPFWIYKFALATTTVAKGQCGFWFGEIFIGHLDNTHKFINPVFCKSHESSPLPSPLAMLFQFLQLLPFTPLQPNADGRDRFLHTTLDALDKRAEYCREMDGRIHGPMPPEAYISHFTGPVATDELLPVPHVTFSKVPKRPKTEKEMYPALVSCSCSPPLTYRLTDRTLKGQGASKVESRLRMVCCYEE